MTVSHQASFKHISGAVIVVANMHTIDGAGHHHIPSATRDNFLRTALGNVLVGCAATPALGHDGIWVVCGDTNMSIVAATDVVEKSPGQLTMVSGPDDKRDFIISSGKLLKYRQILFLNVDNLHWAVAAHALPDRANTTAWTIWLAGIVVVVCLSGCTFLFRLVF